jgi:hypothetical protein
MGDNRPVPWPWAMLNKLWLDDGDPTVRKRVKGTGNEPDFMTVELDGHVHVLERKKNPEKWTFASG